MTTSRLFGLVLCAALAACSSNPGKNSPGNPLKGQKNERELRLEADELYKLARRSMDSSDYAGALTRYDQIITRYPYTDYATQAQLESVYARYRNFQAEGASSAADRFLKEHPRHPTADYIYYLKGLIDFQSDESLLEKFPLVDATKQDVSYAQRAFDDFALLVQKFPNSRYNGDARSRMIYLRNRIAKHEVNIVRYYIRRGAYVAAAKRAEKILSDYPGAPVTLEALELLEQSYRDMGLTQQADDAKKLLDANRAVTPAPKS